MVDEYAKSEMLKMTDVELCQLVSIDLDCLAGLKQSGARPEMGVWKRYIDEIETARAILRNRWC